MKGVCKRHFGEHQSWLIDTEWSKLEELQSLLEPFAAHTDLLQTDALSLSYVIPSTLDLDCHLQQFTTAKLLTSAMRADIQQRFAPILEQMSHNFNPLSAPACFVDSNVGSLLLTPHSSQLMDAAKLFMKLLLWTKQKPQMFNLFSYDIHFFKLCPISLFYTRIPLGELTAALNASGVQFSSVQ